MNTFLRGFTDIILGIIIYLIAGIFRQIDRFMMQVALPFSASLFLFGCGCLLISRITVSPKSISPALPNAHATAPASQPCAMILGPSQNAIAGSVNCGGK